MKLYQQSFGFREPYQVLVSADFILEGVAKHLQVVKTLEDALQGKAKPLITFCSIRDVRTDSEHRSEAIAVSKSFEKRRCPHKEPIPGNQCIGEVMGEENKYNYCVAVQDEVLRASLRKVPGVPLVRVKQSTMVLEKPQSLVKEMVESKNREKLGLSDLERKMLEAVKKMDREAKLAQLPPKHRKKKGPKGPNPLSVRRSKKEAHPQKPSKPKPPRSEERAPASTNEPSVPLPIAGTKRSRPEEAQQPYDSSQRPNTVGQQNKRKRKRSHAKGKNASTNISSLPK
ncbi:hypothetical protein LPJ81_003029 [Coemansia sp. IMI 209127]|nr:hypothetical protein LPJ81_003029 [Coemansia sp. IMI 209127]